MTYDQLLNNCSKLWWTFENLLITHLQNYDYYAPPHNHIITFWTPSNTLAIIISCSIPLSHNWNFCVYCWFLARKWLLRMMDLLNVCGDSLYDHHKNGSKKSGLFTRWFELQLQWFMTQIQVQIVVTRTICTQFKWNWRIFWVL